MKEHNSHFYYPGLDALRGIAILAVIIYHYFPLFGIGWIGVDLFFVLSGFLITSILLTASQGKSFITRFYLRRIFRIFPLYFGFLLVFYAGMFLLFDNRGVNSTFQYYVTNFEWFFSFLQNWLLINKGLPPEPYLQHFWSLAVEEQFYLAWPFFFLIRDVKLLKWCTAVLFLAALLIRIFQWEFARNNEAFYFSTFSRMDSLMAGAFLVFLTKEKKKISRHLLTGIISFYVLFLITHLYIFGHTRLDSPLFATIGYSITAIFFMGICHIVIEYKTAIAGWTWLCRIGRTSYGLYVFHLPVYLAMSALIQKTDLPENGTITSILIPLTSFAMTLLISAASYKYFEVPLLRKRPTLQKNLTSA